MKELLLEDANRLSASISEYEATRQKIDAAVYQTFTLNEVDFNDLVFMEANDNVWADNQTLVDTLTPKGKSRTLREVVDRILKVYPYQNPIKVFKHLSEDEPWFDGCFIIITRYVKANIAGATFVKNLGDLKDTLGIARDPNEV